MADKIVVCCRFSHEGIRGANASHYLTRARALTTRAEALGATLCAWSALTMAFAWDPDGLEEAVDLVTTLTGDAGDASPGEPPTPWACGIAQGELEPLADTGSRADLAWGTALVIALALSRIAKYGEVLVHGSLAAVANGTLNTLDARTEADVGFEARGLRLDRKNPWQQRRKVSTPNLDAVRPPQPPPPPLVVAPPPPPMPQIPSPVATKPAAPAPPAAPLPATAPPGAPPLMAPPPMAPPPMAPPPVQPLPPVPMPALSGVPSPVISALAPMRPRAQTFPSIPATRYSTPSSIDTEEVDPEALAARLMQLSKDALLGGDTDSLEKWSEGLMATGEKDNFAERMRAMARLSNGRVGDALCALGAARKNADSTTPTKRCQAALALAVGFAFAGRTDEALLEGLDALARAREGKDDRATRACLAFLAKLYTSVGRTADATHLSAAASQLVTIPPAAR